MTQFKRFKVPSIYTITFAILTSLSWNFQVAVAAQTDGIITPSRNPIEWSSDEGKLVILDSQLHDMSMWIERGDIRIAESNPAACTVPVRIMPLGNSITKGTGTCHESDPPDPLDELYWNCTGYRPYLWSSLVNDGYDVDFVGSQGTQFQDDYDGDPYPYHDNDHEGHGSYSIDEVRDNLYGSGLNWLGNYPADVILLHIGTNDIESQDVPGIVTEVGQILDKVDQYEVDNNTQITVILARIINYSDPFSESGLKVTQFNNALQVLANARIAAGDKIKVVDMESALIYPDDLSDTAHPNGAGYFKMAEVWKAALDVVLSCAVDDTKVVKEDSGITTISVLANDSGGSLTVTEVGPGSAGGSITTNGSVIYYEPMKDYFGSETFNYTINDGLPPNDRKQAQVTVTVQPVLESFFLPILFHH